MQYTDHFRAMNTDIDVIVDLERGGPPFAEFASVRALFAREEERFSRFRPASLLSRLNRGEAINDARFVAVCRLAIEAYEFSGGLFNPMVAEALAEAGYDRTLEEVGEGCPRPQPVPSPALALAFPRDAVRLTAGSLDLGGIVKGWTADQAVEIVRPGLRGVLVNAGGDLRAEGCEEGLDGWLLSVRAPDASPGWDGVMTGALATSTTLKRRWGAPGGRPAHHLIDPRTGVPSESGIVQASAWGPLTWQAEAWAKSVVVGGAAVMAAAEAAGFRILAFSADGAREGGPPVHVNSPAPW